MGTDVSHSYPSIILLSISSPTEQTYLYFRHLQACHNFILSYIPSLFIWIILSSLMCTFESAISQPPLCESRDDPLYEPVFNPSLTVPLNLIPYLTMSNFVYFVSKPPYVHLYLIFHLSSILHLIPNRFPSIYILIFQLPLPYVLSHYAFPFPCESFIFHGFESQSTLPSAVNWSQEKLRGWQMD